MCEPRLNSTGQQCLAFLLVRGLHFYASAALQQAERVRSSPVHPAVEQATRRSDLPSKP